MTICNYSFRFKSYLVSNNLILVGIILVALLIRIRFAWPFLTGGYEFFMGDDDDYYRLAISLIQTGRLEDHGLVAYRMPIFPIFLAGIYSIFGTSPHVALYFIILVSSLTCLLVYLLAKFVFDESVGLLGAFLTAIDIDQIFYSGLILTESLFIFLVTGSLLSLEQLRKAKSWQWVTITGLLFGLATLTRVNWGIFLPIVVIWLVWTSFNRWQGLKISIAISFIVIGIWSVWLIRNYVELNAIIPFTTQSGAAYYGIYNDTSGNFTDITTFGHWFDFEIPHREYQYIDEVGKDNYLKSLAGQWIRDNPVKAIQIALIQPFHLWNTHWLGYAKFPYIIMLPVIVVGTIWSYRIKKTTVLLWVSLAVILSLWSVFSIGIPRFRLVLHPLMMILAAFAFVTSFRSIATKWHLKNL
jgi:4-amino-4-deoxy-L-arabinose transferase-like glycosyltransferase